ncbi:hypothetical protein GCM10022251_81030 [Phytohabitans flavus]|uniref:CU044_5270 family protein n=1 Tax=Phytohabitans flavus TaxID=1076124 RepID=A0A6F8XL70_9ACTN|nr:CU044_5270 family protein [Phytohabitans flavus]BCB74557.1 hypothetical protein Pflav_009670 [Phytohabitans flavus]
MTTPDSPAARRRPRRAALATTVVLAVAAVLAVPWLIGADQPAPARVAAQPASPPATATSAAAGLGCLRELAAVVAAGAPEAATAGRYAFVHSRWWGEDIAYSETTGSTQTMSTYESKRWRAADGSGREDQIAIPGTHTRPDQTFHHTAGGMPGIVAEPIATSPTVLAAQLAVHAGPPELGPVGLLRVVADVYKYHTVPRDARMVLLRLLANLPGLQCEGPATDREGRNGVAVAVVTDLTRHRLIFDAFTGRLLAEEELWIRNPPALQGPVPRARSYWLFIADGRVDTLPR